MNKERLFYSALPFLRQTGALALYGHLSSGPRRMVFLYHRVGPQGGDWMLPSVPLKAFEHQMAYLSTHFTLVALDELAQMLRGGAPLPHRLACVTFDDGYKDTCTQAVPVLKKYDIPATAFLSAGIIDARDAFWWDRACYSIMNSTAPTVAVGDTPHTLPQEKAQRLRAARDIIEQIKGMPFSETLSNVRGLETQTDACMPREVRDALTVTWDDVKKMHAEGIGIGAHSLTHPSLKHIRATEAEYEIRVAGELIKTRTGITARHFSYPHGHHANVDERIARMAMQSGYESAYTIIPGQLDESTDPYRIGRVLPEYHPDIFHAYTSGFVQNVYGRQ